MRHSRGLGGEDVEARRVAVLERARRAAHPERRINGEGTVSVSRVARDTVVDAGGGSDPAVAVSRYIGNKFLVGTRG
jgi:hypothetical protein